MKNKIILYDLSGKNNIRFSPPCWNVKLCLLHNYIDFDTIPIRFTEKNKISFSNQTLVPIIKYNKEIVYDSWNIFVWLNDKIKEIKLIPNEQTRIFSHFLYFWTSKSLLPIILMVQVVLFHLRLQQIYQKVYRYMNQFQLHINMFTHLS